MKKILFFLLIINQLSFAQTTDLGRLNWTFRGPSNDILESKSIVDIETDPNDATENTVWALSLGGELFVNRAISNANSQWSKINVPEQLIKIYFEPNPTKKLYAISDHNLYLTQDEGKTWQNLLYSADKLTGLVIAKTGRIFLQTPKGITVNLNPNQWIAVEASASTQMWVNFNNRLFWKDTTSQYFYSDNPYLTKIPVSLSEIQAQGFASVGLEHFGAFIVPNGLYHGYRSSSQRIITDKNTFSIDGGVSFIQATFPENMNEVVFSGNNLIFATKKGVFLQKPANQPTETRNLGLEGEYRMAAIRPQSGDDLVSVISDKYAFTLRNQENSIAFIANTTDVGEWVWASWVKDKNGAASIFRTISNGNEETRKHTEIDNNFTFLLHESDRLYRFKNNTRTLLIDYPSVLVDYSYESLSRTAFTLYRDGSIKRLNVDDLKIVDTKIPITQNLAFIRHDDSNLQRILVTDNSGIIYTTTNNGTTWRTLSETPIKGTGINFIEHYPKSNVTFVATNKAIWAVRNIFDTTPTWTNITQSLPEQVFKHVFYRDEDGYLLLTSAKKGVYSTYWQAVAKLQIVTYPPMFLTEPWNINFEQNITTICTGTKINVPFVTNIPQDGSYKFTIEAIGANSKTQLVESKAFQNYMEVTIPLNWYSTTDFGTTSNPFRFLISATINSTTIKGSPSSFIDMSSYWKYGDPKKALIGGSSYDAVICNKDSVILKSYNPALKTYDEYFKNTTYSWQKDKKVIPNATKEFYVARENGLYERVTQVNGCNVTMSLSPSSPSQPVIREGVLDFWGKTVPNIPYIEQIDKNNSIVIDYHFNYISFPQNQKDIIYDYYKDGELLDISKFINEYTYTRWKTGEKINSSGFVFKEDGTYYKTRKGGNCPTPAFRVGRQIQNQSLSFKTNGFGFNSEYHITKTTFLANDLDSGNNPKDILYQQFIDNNLAEEMSWNLHYIGGAYFNSQKDGIHVHKVVSKSNPKAFIETLPIKYTNNKAVWINRNKTCAGITLESSEGGTWFRDNAPTTEGVSGNKILIKQAGSYRTANSASIAITADDFLKSPKIVALNTDLCQTKNTIKIDDDNLIQFSDFQWLKDGKKLDNETYPFLKITESGTYALQLKTEDGVSCTFTPTYRFEKQADFNANLVISNGNNCVVESFKVYTDFNNTYKYEWRKDGQILENAKTNELIISDLSKYNLTIQRPDGCKLSFEPFQLKTCADPKTNKAMIINKPLIEADKNFIYSNEKSILKAVGCSDANFQWLLDNQPIKDAKSNQIEVNKNGNYTLQIEKSGCIATSDAKKITVEALLSAEDEIEVNINVYPNPTDEKVRVDFSNYKNSTKNIYLNDSNGKLLNKWSLSADNQSFTEIDLKDLPTGNYFLRIEIDRKTINRKIIKH